MNIITNITNKVNNIIGSFIPKQNNSSIIINGKKVNALPAIDFKDCKKLKYSSFRNYFPEETIELTNGTITIEIPTPSKADLINLEFYDENDIKVIPLNIEYYTGSENKTYPKYQITNEYITRLLYDTTYSNSSNNRFAVIMANVGNKQIIFKLKSS